MDRPWAAEHVVTSELAASLIDSQFPDLRPARVEPHGEGWDNTVFRVNEKWVFRFPRRSVAVACLEAEVRLLPSIAPRLPIRVPVPRWLGRPEERFPWPFYGHEYLHGTVAARARLTNDERVGLARPLGEFLLALHRLPTEELERMGAPEDEWQRLNVKVRVPKALATMATLVAEGRLPENLRKAASLALEKTHVDVVRRERVLVHGDLYGAQVLLDRHRRIAGVIDWGDIHLGDCAVDLGGVCELLPPSARNHFYRAYGGVDPTTDSLARFRALTHAVSVLTYASEIGDEALTREAKLSLEWAAQ